MCGFTILHPAQQYFIPIRTNECWGPGAGAGAGWGGVRRERADTGSRNAMEFRLRFYRLFPFSATGNSKSGPLDQQASVYLLSYWAPAYCCCCCIVVLRPR